MKIAGISNINNSYRYKNTAFKSSTRSYNVSGNKMLSDMTIMNTTYPFRDDIDLFWLARYLGFNFRDKPHVNIQNLACSDGSEPYSLAIAIDQVYSPREANKLFPIIASDADESIINIAKQRKINLDLQDMSRLKMLTNGQEYFKNPEPAMYIDNEKSLHTYNAYTPVDRLRNNVSFVHKDIKGVLESLHDNGDTAILCRNVTPYLKTDYLMDVVGLLATKLKPDSLLVLGEYDKYSNIINMLPNNFKPIIPELVYKVKPKNF